MKHLLLFVTCLLWASSGFSQCYPAPVYGPARGMIGEARTFSNSISGGRWNVTDSTMGNINPTTGVFYGRAEGLATVEYFMPGACILFSSNNRILISKGIRLPDSVEVGRTITAVDSVSSTATWLSTDTTKFRVHPTTGAVTGISRGTAEIICTFISGGFTFTVRKRLWITSGQSGRWRLYTGDTATRSHLISGGTWRSDDTSILWIDPATGLMQGRNPGRAIITVDNSIGGVACSSFDTLTVGKGLYSTRTVCESDSVRFIDSATGGTWTSSDISVASVSATGWVLGIGSGWTNISYTITRMGSTFVISDSVFVNPPPSISHLSPISICNGLYTTVGMLASGTYLVSFSDPSLVYLSSAGRITTRRWISSPTTTIMTYVDRTCPHVADTATITVYPDPYPGTIVGGNVSICPSDSVQFSITGVTGGTWIAGSGAMTISSTGLARVITPFYDTTGLYVYHHFIDVHGCQNYAMSNFTQLPAVLGGTILGTSTLNMGIIGNYTTTGRGTTSSWSVTPASIGTISSTGQFTPYTTGTATIKHYVSTVCGNDSATRTITVVPPVFGATCSMFTGFVNAYCSAPQFGISCVPHTAPFKILTYYGDGQYDTLTVAATSSTTMSYYTHAYAGTGTYSIKQILYIGSWPADSVKFSYTHVSCSNIYLSFYEDVDHDCAYTPTTDHIGMTPIHVRVDSNGVPVDTLIVTSGLYYTERGNPGDVYSFRMASAAASMTCPSSGVIYDTLRAGTVISGVRNVGFNCTGTGFDMAQYSTATTGRHHQILNVDVANFYCSGEDATVQVDIDPRYNFQNANPYPTSVSGSRLTWNVTGVSSIRGVVPHISIDIETPGSTSSWLAPGTPVQSQIKVIPVHSGDIDTNNNVIQRWDTVKSSYDPNKVEVSPGGNVIGGAILHYTIEFENDGNDTARNIYVMDTLPDQLDVNSLEVVWASARMNTQIIRSGGHNIVKFDFPGINLPDSTSHYLCRGRVFFNIRTNRGLAEGTSVINHAGIFFDDNPVVLTDTAYNTILVPAINAVTTCNDTICRGGAVHCMATAHTTGNTHFEWNYNGSTAGTDSLGFSYGSPVTGDSIRIMMTTIMDDTVRSFSNWMHLTERALPDAGTITGPTAVCLATNIALTNSVAGGNWTMANSHASITAAGVVTGHTSGTDTAIYTTTNICYPNSSYYPISVLAIPSAGTLTGVSAVCRAANITLSASSTGGRWLSTTGRTTVAGGIVAGVYPGPDTIKYITANICGEDTSYKPMYVDTLLRPVITGIPTWLCATGSTVATGSPTGGSWATSNPHATVASGVVTAASAGTDTVIYIVGNSCGVTAANTVFTIYANVTPAVTARVVTVGSICEGNTVVVAATGTNGGSSPYFYWEHAGTIVGSGDTLTYAPSVGDAVVCHMVSNAVCRLADTVVSTLTSISVNPAVHPSMVIVASPSDTLDYSGQLVNFYSTTNYGGSNPTYQWYLNGSPIPGATSISYSLYATPGDVVNCNMTSDAACAAETMVSSNSISLIGKTTFVAPIGTFRNLTLYPNPNNGIFTVSGEITAGNTATVEITEATGKQVYTAQVNSSNGHFSEVVDMKGLASGSYFVRIIQLENYAVMHFVID